jgi:hypothetical protein
MSRPSLRTVLRCSDVPHLAGKLMRPAGPCTAGTWEAHIV